MYPNKSKRNKTLNAIGDNKVSFPKYYSDKEQDSKKKLIVIKVLEDLKKRNKTLVEHLNLTDKFLKQSLNSLIQNESLTTFDYSKFLSSAEQELIVDSVIKSNSANKNFNNNNNNNNFNLIQNSSVDSFDKQYEKEKNVKNRNERINNEYKGGANGPSMKNSITNGLNYNHTNAKFDELKLLKEKDEWGILAKKNYIEHLEDKISKLQKKEEKKKEINEILAKQILEKNHQKQIKICVDEKFFESLNKDAENWRKSEAKEKEHNEHKLKEFIEKRDNIFKSNLE